MGALYSTPGGLGSARGHREAAISRYVVDLAYQRGCERDNRESKSMSAIDIQGCIPMNVAESACRCRCLEKWRHARSKSHTSIVVIPL